jgi:O-antigen ligase
MSERDLTGAGRAHRGAASSSRGRAPTPAPSEVPQYSYVWLLYVVAAVAAVGLAFAVFKLHYSFGQAPHRIVKLLAGASLFVIVFFRPRIALFAWLLAMPIGEWLPATGIPGVNGPNLLFIIMLFSWVIPRILRGEKLAVRTRIAIPLAVYIAVLFLSVFRAAAAPPGGASYDLVRMLKTVWQGGIGFAIYFVVANTVKDEKEVSNLLVTLGVGCGMGALIAMRQYMGTDSTRRIAGSLGDINDLAAYFAMCASMLVGLGFASGAFSRVKGLVIWGSAALTSVAVLLPKSRGGFVGVACGIGYLAYMTGKKAFIGFLIVLALSPFWAPGFVKDRIAETRVDSIEASLVGDPTDRLDPSAGVRLEIWGIVLRASMRSPIIGYGYGTVPYLTRGSLNRPFSAHSLYFGTLGETGLVGLVILFWLISACARSGMELRRLASSRLNKGLATGFLAALAALLVANVFGQRFAHISIAGTFFFIAGLVDRSIMFERAARAPEGAKGEFAS